MPTDETTLADRVREAREAMMQGCGLDNRLGTPVFDELVDAYAEAIRAEHAAEIAALKAVLERIADFDCREAGVTDRTYCGHCPACIAHDAIDASRASEPRGRE